VSSVLVRKRTVAKVYCQLSSCHEHDSASPVTLAARTDESTPSSMQLSRFRRLCDRPRQTFVRQNAKSASLPIRNCILNTRNTTNRSNIIALRAHASTHAQSPQQCLQQYLPPGRRLAWSASATAPCARWATGARCGCRPAGGLSPYRC